VDRVVRKLAAFGVPGLVFLVAVAAANAAGVYGAAAYIVALVAIGPGGILGGIVTLGLVAWISDAITKWGFEAVARGLLDELQRRGYTRKKIQETIDKYWWLSRGLRRRLNACFA
jgi:hypothetical protein